MVEQRKASASATRKKSRSPSYPAIGLQEAVEKARILYQKEGKHGAPISTIVDHWGYRSLNGASLVAFAALKKFGLIVDEGSGDGRRARLSGDAIQIILDEREDTTERQALLKEAALKPTIHRELWDKYGGALPSDSNLRHDLLFTYGFAESAVRDFIRQFRETLTFTGLTGSGTLEGQEEGKSRAGDQNSMSPTPPGTTMNPSASPPANDSKGREIAIPVALDEYAILKAAFPLTEAKWAQMLAVLSAMKPAIVAPEPTRDLSERDE